MHSLISIIVLISAVVLSIFLTLSAKTNTIHTPKMKRQIPLHIPQAFPTEWNQSAVFTAEIPTEEQLTRKDYMDDDFYNNHVRVGMNLTALVYAAMHAFASTQTPEIAYAGGGSFNEVFSLTFSEGFKVAARIPRPSRRVPGRMESTVAMMTIARCYRAIPVPEVYAWYPGDDNPVGAPYMLLEWVEGVEPWEQWHELSSNDQKELLNELAVHHANFAKPLPFQGIGSIYFRDLADADVDLSSPSSYRLGPLSRGPACTTHRGISTWPQSIPTSLRELWLELWQHEVDSLTKTFGFVRSTIIATEDHPSSSIQDTITLGQFLDVAEALRVLIRRCPLPSQSQLELYELGFGSTDYAFRNIKMDPKTRKITAFLDWDDVYVMPFLLCSRYPEDICWYDGSGERWYDTGAFLFMPIDEEGEIEGDIVREVEASTPVDDSETPSEDEEGSNSDSTSQESVDYAGSDDVLEQDEGDNELNVPDESILEHDSEDYDRPRRIKDTRLRRQYELFLASHDSRFGAEGFWDMRKEPVKLQHLLMHGWIEWLVKEEWIKKRAAEM